MTPFSVLNALSAALRSLDHSEEFAPHPAERLALDEGDPLLKNRAQILAAFPSALGRLDEDLELVPIAGDRFLYLSNDVRDDSPRATLPK